MRSLAQINFSAIPTALQERPQWLLWRYEANPKKPDKKPRKVPYYAHGGRRHGDQGSEADRKALATFEACKRAFAGGRYDGLNFAFLPGDGLIGVDFDDAINPETGEIDETARALIEACGSYTEVSPSGKGLHIFLGGTTARHSVNAKGGLLGIEIFAGGQSLSVTGHHWSGTPEQVAPADVKLLQRLHREVDRLIDIHKPKQRAEAQDWVAPPINSSADRATDMLSALQAIPAADLDRRLWIGVGMDLRAELGDAGFAPFDAWSAEDADRYDASEMAMQWRSFRNAKSSNLIFRLALDRGWKAPRRERPASKKSAPNPKGQSADRAREKAPEQKPAAEPAGEAEGYEGSDDDAIADPVADTQAGEPSAPQGGGGNKPKRLRMPFVNDKGTPKGIRENVYYALLHDDQLKGLVVFDEFSELHMKTRPAPWEGKGSKPYESPIEWHTIDSLQLAHYMAAKHRVIVGNPMTIDQAVDMASRDCRVNPVREYLESLVWDGTDRLQFWLHDIIGTPQRDYAALAGTRFFIQLVARVMEPGCKADYALILQGGQGRKKSSLFRVIGGRWYAETPFKIGDKDAYMVLQGIWLYEMSELDALSRAESNAAKAFISSRFDRFRAPYGQRVTSVPRRTVLGGTTNPEQFLKDTTGERRYWPFHVAQEIDLDALESVRDQLFAEAVHRYRAGERWWNEIDEEEQIFDPEREPFSQVDPWVDKLSGYVNSERITLQNDEDGDPIEFADQKANADRDFFSTMELLTKGLGVEASRIDRGKQMQGAVASCMRVLGFAPHRETGGKRRRGYMRKPATPLVAGSQTGTPRPAPAPGPAPDSQLSPAERARRAVEAAHVPL